MMTQAPPPPPPAAPGMGMRPHRGTTILVLGILSIVCGCFILGIVAWVMGNGDLKAMAAGQMDPSGESLTKAGKIMGIISVVLALAYIALNIVFIILGVGISLIPMSSP